MSGDAPSVDCCSQLTYQATRAAEQQGPTLSGSTFQRIGVVKAATA